MKKKLLFIFLLTAGLIVSTEIQAQKSPVEVQNVPPAVQETWSYLMATVYFDLFGRYGVTTWYRHNGTCKSITVYRIGSTVVRLFMEFTPQGELLSAETDL